MRAVRRAAVEVNADDAEVLRRLVALFVGELLVGNLDGKLTQQRMLDVFRSQRQLTDGDGIPELRLRLAQLGKRLAIALYPGYASGADGDGMTSHKLIFPGVAEASGFIEDVRDLSEGAWVVLDAELTVLFVWTKTVDDILAKAKRPTTVNSGH